MAENVGRRHLAAVPSPPDAGGPQSPPKATSDEVPAEEERVRLKYVFGGLSGGEAAQMMAELAGREETAAEYGWRADLVFEGLLRCAGCGERLGTDLTAGVVAYICPDGSCRPVRIAARTLGPVVVGEVLRRLAAPAAPGLLLSIAQRRGSVFDWSSSESVETWWAGADPAVQKELLGLLLECVDVLPSAGPGGGLDMEGRLLLVWRRSDG